MAERFCEVGRGMTLCYEAFGDRHSPPILLVMGLGTQMVGWHEDFCRRLADSGFYAIRFDNRDSGRSTHCGGMPPRVAQLAHRRLIPSRQYTLADMADDARGLLRELDLAPAHVIGASMGGAIAQTLAARDPAGVRSLTSIMSGTGSRWTGQPALSMYRHLLRTPPTDREAYIEHAAQIFSIVGSTGMPQDPQDIRERAARSYDRGHDPAATRRQLAAIIASGDRTKALGQISAPTLVIHGQADRLVKPSGGQATARAIPGARLMMIEGMGHDLPRAVWPQIIDAFTEHAARADGARQAA